MEHDLSMTVRGKGMLFFRPNHDLFVVNAALGEDAPVPEQEFGVSVDTFEMMRSLTEIGKFLAPQVPGSTLTLGFPEHGVEDERGLLYGIEAGVRSIVRFAEAEGASVFGDLCWFDQLSGQMVSVMDNQITVSGGEMVVRFSNGKVVEV